jgi:hypothetical protein
LKITIAFDSGHIDCLVFFSFSIIPFDNRTNFIVIDVVYASFDRITSYEIIYGIWWKRLKLLGSSQTARRSDKGRLAMLRLLLADPRDGDVISRSAELSQHLHPI